MNSDERTQTLRQQPTGRNARGRRLISPGDFTYTLASLFLRGMQLLPVSKQVRVINSASRLLANVLCGANVHSTKVIRHNISSVLDLDRSPEVIEADVRQLLTVTIWNSLILNSLPVLRRFQLTDLVRIEGTSYLDDYLANGHPVLIWSYHLGVHPLIVAASLHALGYPIHAITHARQMPARASFFHRLYLRRLRRTDYQFPVIDPREGVQREILDVLRNKECLYVTPDYMIPQDERQPQSAFEVPVDFLFRKAYLQTGALRLAKRLKACIVTILSAPVEGDQRRLIIEPFEWPTPGLTPAELQQDLQICMRRLEVRVLAHPFLWLDLKRDDLAKRLLMA